MGNIRGLVAAFVIGFTSCAVTARLVLPTPVAASSPAIFRNVSSADVATAVEESVVSIECFSAADLALQKTAGGFLAFGNGDPDEPSCLGSGVIVSQNGEIVTNNHVVDDAARIRVRLASGGEHDAKLVGRDAYTDLALIRIDGKKLHPAQFADSHSVRPGDAVLAVGNPLGFENSISTGIVSASRKGPFRIDGRTMGDMIQTDAAINQGNSGGGLFNAEGKLIGINTAIITPRGGSGNIGIGFAIPTHRARPVIDKLRLAGWVARPWLGVTYELPRISNLIRRIRGGNGVRLEQVVPGSPAAAAGLQPNDRIVQLGDSAIRSVDDIYDFVERHQPGEKVATRVLRGGRAVDCTVVLGHRPRNEG
jgi:serine protease Do